MNNILTGTFTADGNDKVLDLGVEVQWFEIINKTVADGTTDGSAFHFKWTVDMENGSMYYYHPAADHTSAVEWNTTGFEQFDTSTYAGGSKIVVTGGTNATQPLYSTGDTTGLSDGAIVRIIATDQKDINGYHFSIDTITANTSFRLANTLATAPGIISGAGHYQLVAPNLAAYDMMFPASRVIGNITQATSAVVTTLVDHGYSVNDLVRLAVDDECKMIEMNGLQGTITAVTDSTFTVNIDSSGFTAFEFPEYNNVNFTHAQANVIGDTTTLGFDGSKRNAAFKGMILSSGATKPAGVTNDVIYWRAGKAGSTY